jgi:hypothetical protein
MTRVTTWTAAEDAVLREHYPTGGFRAVHPLLPGRSVGAVQCRASRLRIPRNHRWTDAHDAKLRRLWTGDKTLREIARALGRTPYATHKRAEVIGLPLGLPTGWEHLNTAVRRTGFDHKQLRAILAAADVPVRPLLSRPMRRDRHQGRVGQHHMVWPADVDAAVADWLEREPVKTMARRFGVDASTLLNRLIKVVGRRPPRGKRWRITEAEARRALAAQLVRTRTGRLNTGAHYVELLHVKTVASEQVAESYAEATGT